MHPLIIIGALSLALGLILDKGEKREEKAITDGTHKSATETATETAQETAQEPGENKETNTELESSDDD